MGTKTGRGGTSTSGSDSGGLEERAGRCCEEGSECVLKSRFGKREFERSINACDCLVPNADVGERKVVVLWWVFGDEREALVTCRSMRDALTCSLSLCALCLSPAPPAEPASVGRTKS